MSDLISRADAIEAIASRDETDGTVKVFTGREVNEILSALPSADRQDDNRLYIKIYADDEPSRKAEKLYQICGETENQEVAQWLKEYFPSADRPTMDKEYLIDLIQEAVYDGEACAKLIDLVDRPTGE